MASFRTWIQAARPLAQANLAIPLLYGEMLAFARTGDMAWGAFAAAHLFAVVDHLFIVFANDLADEAGDRQNETFNQFSGGSRVLCEGKLTRGALRTGAITAALALVLLSAGTALLFARPLALGAGAAALVLLWAYSFRPLQLSYRGHGEWLQGLGTGAVLPLLGFHLQADPTLAIPWGAFAAPVVLGVAGNILTSLPDQPADTAVDKRSVPVRIGAARARRRFLQLVALGILLAPLALPGASKTELLWVEGPPLLFVAAGAWLGRRADAEDRAGCLRFIWCGGLAINVAFLTLCVALGLRGGL